MEMIADVSDETKSYLNFSLGSRTTLKSHVPVARGASLSRGITDEGHGGGIAYFTSTEF